MKSHCRVAVIGGGVVGCSVLYHLTKLGWSDVVLIERKELTAGSSWHAAGGFHALNSDPGVARLQSYTISLYEEIERISGQDVGLHMTGGLNVAATKERWEFLKADHARHRTMGLETELVTPSDIAKLCPIIDASELYGALYDKHEGHVDPSGATHAYAKAARMQGAEIYRHTRVIDLQPTGRGTWRVITDQGEIEAEHVVNAAGLWAREMGAMVGVQLPLIPLEHHYLLTEDIAEVAALETELPLVLDLDAEIYLRQERQGVLLGVYEKNATPWAVDGTPWEYGENELLIPDLERLSDALMKGFQRFPSVAAAGIRRQINGPFTFTPDGNPLVGPVRGVPNYWSACGVMAGFAQGGGVGLTLAQWIIDGEPDGDVYAMDVARFGDYASPTYVIDKAREFYAKRFQIAYPNEYWPAGRPVKTDVLYDTLAEQNAVFGVGYALEQPLYFAPDGSVPEEAASLKRSNAFPKVGLECLAVQKGVGVFDCSSFAKYEFSGPSAEAALDRIVANKLPSVGEVQTAPLLSSAGRLMGELTIMRVSSDRFLLTGSGYLQNWHMRWFEEHMPTSGVTLTNLSDAYQGIAITGPRSRELLQRMTASDVSAEALPYLRVAKIDIGYTSAIVSRHSISGELGYEIYVPALHLRSIYKLAMRLGEELGVSNYGIYALFSMRLEKSIGIWSHEFTRDYTPKMCGLDAHIDYHKPDFIGRDAALHDRDTVPPHKLACFLVDADDADASANEAIWHNNTYAGYVTSGGYGHRTNASLAFGYVSTELLTEKEGFKLNILGHSREARLLSEPLYDPGRELVLK